MDPVLLLLYTVIFFGRRLIAMDQICAKQHAIKLYIYDNDLL